MVKTRSPWSTFRLALKNIFIGQARNPRDRSVFQHLSLIAFFAWVGLGADGLSSSCYGPAEAFVTLGKYHYLGILIALATALTIYIIAESYSQIVELFPTGGGGYIVASTLLSPTVGMVSGCALLIDYVLTITLSIASGADALFSFLPAEWLVFKLSFAVLALIVLIVMNLRGIKESVMILMPIFLVFVLTHALVIVYALVTHLFAFPAVAQATVVDIRSSASELGFLGMIFLLLRAYSMGAGTYTGIEAVSNGLPILREPKVKTAKRTMTYMMISLAAVVLGLMIAYTLYNVLPVEGKTLNAVLFERVVAGWGWFGLAFVMVTLVSEAAILFVAAQAGFIDGPRVLSSMAADRWVPKRFALLSDRLVTLNGIMIMGVAAIVLMIATNGSVGYLIVLYSINVFVTFCLSQLGMVRHWLQVRRQERRWLGKIAVNGIGLTLTTFILLSVVVVKFFDGGWITLLITGTLAGLMLAVRSTYRYADERIAELNTIVDEVESTNPVREIPLSAGQGQPFDPQARTAVVMVKDFTGIGLRTIFNIFPAFGTEFRNFVFVQVGLIDAAAFKGTEELDRVQRKVSGELQRYVDLMRRHGYHAEAHALYGIDTVEELEKYLPDLLRKYPQAMLFGGQVVFPRRSLLPALMHNYTLFSAQRQLYDNHGLHLYVMPVELTPG
ncbi:MAG: APC family permease [Candidatus Margulisbacteria bacterium]|nr:APC family permease [Candidatus Margulisiibacteriota bacterium]